MSTCGGAGGKGGGASDNVEGRCGAAVPPFPPPFPLDYQWIVSLLTRLTPLPPPWVQDYHLMQLPMLLKNEKPKVWSVLYVWGGSVGYIKEVRG